MADPDGDGGADLADFGQLQPYVVGSGAGTGGWYRTRYFDPTTGRFTTRDTIGIWGDPLNLGNGYTFVGNNPWTSLDPFGLQPPNDRTSFSNPAWVQVGITGLYIPNLANRDPDIQPALQAHTQANAGAVLAVYDIGAGIASTAWERLTHRGGPMMADIDMVVGWAEAGYDAYSDARKHGSMGVGGALLHTGAVGAGHLLGAQYFLDGKEAWKKGDFREAARQWTTGSIHVVTLAMAACAAKDAALARGGSKTGATSNAPKGPGAAPKVSTKGYGNVGGGATTAENALTQAEKYLGPGYKEISPGVYRSADGTRQFRMTNSDLLDPRQGPHVHFEAIGPDGRTIIENSHVTITNP